MPDHKPSDNRPRPSAGRTQGDRTPAQRQADHASLARLSETLVPALVQKLATSGLGELEVREGGWRIRLRRPATAAPGPARRGDRQRPGAHGERDPRSSRDGLGFGASGASGTGAGDAGRSATASVDAGRSATGTEHQDQIGDGIGVDGSRRVVATSPAVGVFRPGLAVGTRVQAGDRVGVVDLLGIPQDVPSPIDGILVEVYPGVGEAVEYGESIAMVEADPEAADPAAGGVDDEPAGDGE